MGHGSTEIGQPASIGQAETLEPAKDSTLLPTQTGMILPRAMTYNGLRPGPRRKVS